VAILVRAIELVVILMMGVITGVVIGETVMRGVFGVSLIVTDELSRYLMVWTALLAAALLVYEDGHIRIALLPDALGPVGGRIVYALSQLVVIGFLVAVIVASLMIMPSITRQSTVTLGLSMAWFYAALPVSSALMVVFALRNLVAKLRESIDPPTSAPAR
jgi:TRAP-type C4-dicarboxylate transport system permease small subunit